MLCRLPAPNPITCFRVSVFAGEAFFASTRFIGTGTDNFSHFFKNLSRHSVAGLFNVSRFRANRVQNRGNRCLETGQADVSKPGSARCLYSAKWHAQQTSCAHKNRRQEDRSLPPPVFLSTALALCRRLKLELPGKGNRAHGFIARCFRGVTAIDRRQSLALGLRLFRERPAALAEPAAACLAAARRSADRAADAGDAPCRGLPCRDAARRAATG